MAQVVEADHRGQPGAFEKRLESAVEVTPREGSTGAGGEYEAMILFGEQREEGRIVFVETLIKEGCGPGRGVSEGGSAGSRPLGGAGRRLRRVHRSGEAAGR